MPCRTAVSVLHFLAFFPASPQSLSMEGCCAESWGWALSISALLGSVQVAVLVCGSAGARPTWGRLTPWGSICAVAVALLLLPHGAFLTTGLPCEFAILQQGD